MTDKRKDNIFINSSESYYTYVMFVDLWDILIVRATAQVMWKYWSQQLVALHLLIKTCFLEKDLVWQNPHKWYW